MIIQKYSLFSCIIIILFCSGCSTSPIHRFSTISERPAEYEDFFYYLDKSVQESDVHESIYFPVHGFPYLRANRFAVALKEKLVNDGENEHWVKLMMQLDSEARKKEIMNLPESAIADLSARYEDPPSKNAILERLSTYSMKMYDHDLSREGFYDAVKKAVNDPGEYSIAMRTLGIYPLFVIPVVSGTGKAHALFKKWHQTPLKDLAIHGAVIIYASEQKGSLSAEGISRMFNSSRRDILGIPQLTEKEIAGLVFEFAPVFSQDVVSDYDMFGEVEWKQGSVTINYHKPTVYYYITHAFIKGEPVLQINYVIWYSGRRGPNAPWMERGALDGLTVRIILDREGLPIMADIMNNCGCYHFFAPRKTEIVQIKPKPYSLIPFVPAWLPEIFPDKRLFLRINSGWHQVQKVYSGSIPSDARKYKLLPYSILEGLPHPDGRTESIFTTQGIIKDSARTESLIFFSMGIPSVGNMRQRGHHAIRLVGYEHFTDPDLFDKNFIFK